MIGSCGHFGDWLGRADAGDDVFALGVDEIFAVEHVFAGGRIAGESDAGGAVVAHVAEDHALDVDGGAPFIGDFVLLAIEDGTFVHPGTEHGADRALELIERVGREFLAGAFVDERFEALDEFVQIGFAEVGVFLDAALVLQAVHHFIERFVFVFVALLHAHDDVAVHLDEAAIGVPGEAAVAGGGLQALRRFCR